MKDCSSAHRQPLWRWGGATTKNYRASSMCPNFNVNRSISSETILKQGFKCKMQTTLSFKISGEKQKKEGTMERERNLLASMHLQLSDEDR